MENAVLEIAMDLGKFSSMLAALGGVSLVVIVSNFYSGRKKALFQSGIFSIFFAVSAGVLVSRKDEKIIALLNSFRDLAPNLQFLLSVLIFSCCYFGGSLYAAGVSATIVTNITPASCDSAVSFDIPETLPESDKEVFTVAFDQ